DGLGRVFFVEFDFHDALCGVDLCGHMMFVTRSGRLSKGRLASGFVCRVHQRRDLPGKASIRNFHRLL
ncbi:MAG: hypothetical protein KDC43_15280, partial [Saprospiraceae bacterium]|nr:hypothetical protein [Saprospiraceae bacterium]